MDDNLSQMLTACFVTWCIALIFIDRNVYPDEILVAEHKCETANSKLDNFEIGFFNMEITCKNDAKFSVAVNNWGPFKAHLDEAKGIKDENPVP